MSMLVEPTLQTRIRMWGNSASVCIPVAVLAASRLELDQCVAMRAEHGRIIIESAQEAGEKTGEDTDLDRLIARITPANRHGEMSLGVACITRACKNQKYP